MADKKQFLVLGLGHFGASLAVTLQKQGANVIAVDQDMTQVEAVSDLVSYAMRANISDEAMLKSLEIENMDGVIVAAAENMESSIMATLLVKEMGVPYVLAKAKNALHASVLEKVGADEVIRPEYEMGKQVARHLFSSDFSNWDRLSEGYSIVERTVPKHWIGKTLQELDVRNNYDVNVVAVRMKESVEINYNPAQPLPKGAILILVGKDDKLEQIQ